MEKWDDLLNEQTVRAEEDRAIQAARAALGLSPNKDGPVGLALSGGGIRSATFSLGVVQALAEKDSLKRIDYLSTVSGGGYLGAWLSAWIRRSSLLDVEQALKAGLDRDDNASEAPEVTWLRRYSNYLAPKLGLLSADSMTLVATWLRNVFLNLIILATFLAAIFLIPRLLLVATTFSGMRMQAEMGYAAAWLAFFVLPLGIAIHFSKSFMQDADRTLILMNSTWGVLFIVLLPGMFAALLGSISLFSDPKTMSHSGIPWLVGSLLALSAASLVVLTRMAPELGGETSTPGEGVVFGVAYVVSVAIGIVIVSYFVQVIKPVTPSRAERAATVLTFGPPALLLTFGIMGSIIVGIVGRTYRERTREWWSRMNAWFIIIGLSWLALVGLSFYARPLLGWLYASLGGPAALAAGAGWLGSLATTLFGKRPASTERWSSQLKAIAMNIALTVVVVGLLVFVAAGVTYLLESWGKGDPPATSSERAPVELRIKGMPGGDATVTLIPTKPADKSLLAFLVASFAEQDRIQRSCFDLRAPSFIRRGQRSDPDDPPSLNLVDCIPAGRLDATLVAFLGCVIACLLFGMRVDVNKFSLHNLYKNRLTRCYLGASKRERRAHPFTGFDEADDFALKDMAHRPLHIVNAAINITQGRHLAWQERKAASFTFSPLHCGFTLGRGTGDAKGAWLLSAKGERIGGYRRSTGWASQREERDGFSLGMALATSGAAFSPIRGKGSTPATAFLATLFNIRLGRWSPNPLWRLGWERASPYPGLYYLLQELFGHSTETSNFVYLSDGGHFDNSGVYELIRRRCMTVIAVDATADPARGFDDLANLVRKVRVDLGVEINLAFEALGTENEPKTRSKGYVIGEILYPLQTGSKPGRFILIKPTLIELKNLGVDVFSYSRESRTFPHQTTVDQFFSESQFESYRALGKRIATACLDDPEARLELKE